MATDHPPVDLGALWRLIARCAPGEHHSPTIYEHVAVAQHYAARGQWAGMRRWAVEAITLSLLLDRGQLDSSLPYALARARRDAEHLMGLASRYPYGHIPRNGPRFELGRTVITTALLARLEPDDYNGLGIYLQRHERGDWGDVDLIDAAANEYAVRHGERILSVYWLPSRTKVYVITESDRSTTTLLRADDY